MRGTREALRKSLDVVAGVDVERRRGEGGLGLRVAFRPRQRREAVVQRIWHREHHPPQLAAGWRT
jgi:hypothetical protein